MIEQPYWVLDTNTLISRLLAPGGVAAQAVDRALEHGVLLVSEATLDELISVLGRQKFDPYLTQDERRQFVALLGGISRIVPVPHTVRACRDPKDDKFLDVALAGNAKAIITGDKDLLVLDPFHGIHILSPAEFLRTPEYRV